MNEEIRNIVQSAVLCGLRTHEAHAIAHAREMFTSAECERLRAGRWMSPDQWLQAGKAARRFFSRHVQPVVVAELQRARRHVTRCGSPQSFDTEGDMYEAITGHRSAVIK